MKYERLTPQDATFLYLETPHEPQHVGSLSILEGEPLRDATGRVRFEDIRDHIASRLPRVHRLRQRVMDVPLSQGRPIWVDDENFDIDYHVRLTSLPRPGSTDQLTTLMSRLQSLPIDRDRPLWELWIVDGLANDDVGMIIKTHHAMGDGIASVDMALALVDLEPVPIGDPPELEEWTPRPAPSRNRLFVDSVVEQMSRPFDVAQSMIALTRDADVLFDSAGNLITTVRELTVAPAPAPWNVPVSAHRRWVSADVPMSLVRDIREAHDATINDVVLAACSGALRQFLKDHAGNDHTGNQEPAADDDRSLTAIVPVSRRGQDQHGETLGNLVSVVSVELPVDEPDPLKRLELVHERCVAAKSSGIIDGAEMMIKLADGLPMLAPLLTKILTKRMPMNLVITNVPGPPVPLYLCGARVRESYPYVEVLDGAGLTIAVVSYDDHLFFGVTADRDVLPDVHLVADGIAKELQALADTTIH